MVCPYCYQPKTRVINSRPHASRPSVWRRRRCSRCQAIISTYERASERDLPLVMTAEGTRSFSLPRLMVSIYTAIRQQSYTPEDAQALAETVLYTILRHCPTPLRSRDIAAQTYTALQHFDQPSAMRYGLDHGLLPLSIDGSRACATANDDRQL